MCAGAVESTPEERAMRTRRRAVGAIVALATGTVLLLAAWFQPAADGHGTHTQLGLPPCGWVVGMGIPCPSCGMTTSFAHATDGNLLGALQAQPAGALLALGTAFIFVIAVWQFVSGSAIGGFWISRMDKRFYLAGGAVIVLAWIYKILVFKGVF